MQAWLAAVVLAVLALAGAVGLGMLASDDDEAVVAMVAGVTFGHIAVCVWIGWWLP